MLGDASLRYKPSTFVSGAVGGRRDLSPGICSKPAGRKQQSWWRVTASIIIVIICSPALRWMLPDPIKLMGFMSPGVLEGGGGVAGTQEIRVADSFCFLSSLPVEETPQQQLRGSKVRLCPVRHRRCKLNNEANAHSTYSVLLCPCFSFSTLINCAGLL